MIRFILRASVAPLTVATAALLAAAPAGAAPFNVGSGTLTWKVPYEVSPRTLAGYATTIGTSGGANGSVDASGAATGSSITKTSAPAPGLGVTYPFQFPRSQAAATGTYDPATKTGRINFSGTLTFTAHGGTFLSVIDPTLSFDGPGSIRVIANGVAPASQSDFTPTAYGTGAARQTVFALNEPAATTTANPDGSYSITGLVPSQTTTSAGVVSFMSSNAAFNGIRDFFSVDRANQGFSVTFGPATTPPAPTTPVATTPAPMTPEPTTPEPQVPNPYAPQGIAPVATAVTKTTPVIPTVLVSKTIKSKPFGKLTVSIAIRKRGTGTPSLGTGTLKGDKLTVRVAAGTALSGDYVLSRTSGSGKLPKSAVVSIKSSK